MPDAPQALHEDLAQALLTEAEAVRVDPLLVLAMIEVESGFDLGARSTAGAHGLMQVLPSTLQAQAEKLGLGPVDPADPVTNLRLGVRYLRQCLDAYPGSPRLALMAYNSGPNRVYELIQAGDLPEWAQAYPRRVEVAHRRLRQLLGDEAGPRFADARAAAR
jgi:soluble lytic murein transglycosylase-like protein